MDDNRIIELYWQRSESAVFYTKEKYDKYLYKIAYAILNIKEDSEESVNDTYVGAWESMPPHKPSVLRAFLGRITRYISLKRVRANKTEKRGGGEYELALDELSEVISDNDTVEDEYEAKVLKEFILKFIDELPRDSRRIFLDRYWYIKPIKEISKDLGFSQSKVKMTLKRTRDSLAERLREEGLM